jgi:D-alanyl-D-alanine-carboxypeptidase/D-alanyl-D-alanine-endopeptidase
VTHEANTLMVQATGQGKFEVFPESDLKYFARVTELTIAFVKGDDGKVSELILTQGGRDQHAKRIE